MLKDLCHFSNHRITWLLSFCMTSIGCGKDLTAHLSIVGKSIFYVADVNNEKYCRSLWHITDNRKALRILSIAQDFSFSEPRSLPRGQIRVAYLLTVTLYGDIYVVLFRRLSEGQHIKHHWTCDLPGSHNYMPWKKLSRLVKHERLFLKPSCASLIMLLSRNLTNLSQIISLRVLIDTVFLSLQACSLRPRSYLFRKSGLH